MTASAPTQAQSQAQPARRHRQAAGPAYAYWALLILANLACLGLMCLLFFR
ncbi:MAG TPA: hypothetical protein VL359_10555 [bacterium]|nr:hypothetical protein [bacterium]